MCKLSLATENTHVANFGNMKKINATVKRRIIDIESSDCFQYESASVVLKSDN